MTKLDKIGIVQNAPLTADFSNNLRHIVQGYRDCIDHGAELVIAPAYALCGPDVHDLRYRKSFLQQVRSALEALSRELCDAPLLLAAYAPLEAEDDMDFNGMIEEWESMGDDSHTLSSLVPFLLEKDCVTELEEAETVDVQGSRIYVDLSNEEVLPDFTPYDILIHLCTAPWHATAAQQEASSRLWEAAQLDVPVISVHSVGTSEENIYAGGSSIYMPGKRTLLRLPFFQESAKTVRIKSSARARALPEPVELLAHALESGIRDTVTNNGYTGVCVPLDHENSTVLAALCAQALGKAHVLGVTFLGGTDVADKLGLESVSIPLPPVLEAAQQASGATGDSLEARLQGALLCATAETRRLMPLSALDRASLMTGAFTLYGEGCGHLAPLGNLYSMDLHLLRQFFAERHAGLFGALTEPENSVRDRIIHELADRNTSPTELLEKNTGGLFKEDEVRSIQRKLAASALKRSQTPMVLRVDKPQERLSFPVCHRLND